MRKANKLVCILINKGSSVFKIESSIKIISQKSRMQWKIKHTKRHRQVAGSKQTKDVTLHNNQELHY